MKIFRIYAPTLSGREQVALFKRENVQDIDGLLGLDIMLEFWRLNSPASAKSVEKVHRSELPKKCGLRFSVLSDNYENTKHWIKYQG